MFLRSITDDIQTGSCFIFVFQIQGWRNNLVTDSQNREDSFQPPLRPINDRSLI